MAYSSTYDERYYGTYVSSAAGYRDASSYLNSTYVLAEGTVGYGNLTYQSYTADTDVYSLGVLSAGYYSVDVDTYTWDYSNVGFGGVSNFQLINSSGTIVATSFGTYSDIEFTVSSSDTYYVKIVGNFYDDQQYSVTYSFDGEISVANSAAVWGSSGSYYGSLISGETLDASVSYYDADGNSDNIVYTFWYLDGVYQGISDTFTLTDDHIGQSLTYKFAFYDDAGNVETSSAYTAGTILDDVNTINGDAFSNTLIGTSGDDELFGNGGHDSLYMDAGNDTLDGGTGTDWLFVTGSANSVVNLAKTTGQNTGYGTDIIKNIENASGGTGVDKFYGTTGNNTLKGNNGNDILQGMNGNDTLQGGNGNDKSYGQAGNDSLYMDAGNDTLDGGTGTDWLFVTGSANSVVNLAKTTGQNTGYGTDIIKNIENASGGTGVDKFYGTTGNNTLKGNNGNDILQGMNGNDTLQGGNGNDKSYGQAGNDSLYMDAGNDTLDGGTGTDWLFVTGSANSVVNLAKTTGQNTGYGTDIIKNIENASGGTGVDKFYGTTGNNTLKGNNGNDILQGMNGNDTLQGGNGNDKSYGQAGNDSLYMDAGNDTLDGGTGTDWLFVTGSANSVVNLAKTTGQNTGYGTDIIKNIENASGGTGVDKFYGTTGNNTLKGNNGNDILQGMNGNDTLQGGNGNDKSYGQAGNDSLYMDAGNDTLDGGTGTDWLFVTGSANSVVNLAKTTGQNTGYGTDIIKNIENASGGTGVDKFYGTTGNNTLKGNNGNDILQGMNGNDTLQGGNGNDKSYGQAGNDSLYMDAGNDTLDGGTGTDWLFVTGSANSVVNLAKTTGQNTGYGTDIIKNIENASGGTGVDKFYGTTGNNTLKGNNGNDLLYGQNGNDTLYGGNGNDTLKGDAGNDLLQGDAGKDTMFGGAGADTFVFRSTTHSSASASGADIIRDFTRGVDKIDLHFIDASTKLSGNNAFTFDGTTSFGTSNQGEIYFKQFNNDGTANDYTMVYIDTDSDRGTEMSIKLMGLHNLTADDFIL